jgi:hypothetical protein
MHDPDAVSQGDARRWPARHGCPVSRLCHLEVVYPSDMLNDAVACVVPDVHAEGKMRLGLHRGQIRLDWPAPPRYLYLHVVASRSLSRLLRALPAQPSRQAARWGWVAARDQTRRVSYYRPDPRVPLYSRAVLCFGAEERDGGWNFSERQLAIYRDARLRPLAPKIFGLWAASWSLTRRRSATSRRNREISSWSSAIRSPPLRVPSASLRHRCKVITLTPSVRAISLCSFPRLAKSFACASFVATSTLEYRFCLAIAACPQPLRASVTAQPRQMLFFGQTCALLDKLSDKQRCDG